MYSDQFQPQYFEKINYIQQILYIKPIETNTKCKPNVALFLATLKINLFFTFTFLFNLTPENKAENIQIEIQQFKFSAIQVNFRGTDDC